MERFPWFKFKFCKILLNKFCFIVMLLNWCVLMKVSLFSFHYLFIKQLVMCLFTSKDCKTLNLISSKVHWFKIQSAHQPNIVFISVVNALSFQEYFHKCFKVKLAEKNKLVYGRTKMSFCCFISSQHDRKNVFEPVFLLKSTFFTCSLHLHYVWWQAMWKLCKFLFRFYAFFVNLCQKSYWTWGDWDNCLNHTENWVV